MSILHPDDASIEDISFFDTPRITTVGLIYAGLHHITDNRHPLLYYLFSSSMLYTRDFKNVIKLNNFFLTLLDSPLIMCHSMAVPDSSEYTGVSLCPTPQKTLRWFPSVTLELKVGMPIWITKLFSTNFDIDQGARLLILQIDFETIFARFLVKDILGPVVRIERIITSCRDPFNPLLSYVRLQFLVEPAFASVLSWQIEDAPRVLVIFKLYQLT
ncbi:hypothetical protein MJO28_009406 [Puccinia striiformis f. sp. tritici]|uniref:Uncharacterized protein n=1 Tax=Puccinia striiformis f. sp. tritici TaxID=168172 RepID=A0ACC0E7G6_9BASI|nr:hypothetical protein MJO28_009406 [Puccinia striiformis f. sp. tritici]KAI7950242.1 hypothetical protein MJO29_008916 [Puccinia striiformis f. sp. tritici]